MASPIFGGGSAPGVFIAFVLWVGAPHGSAYRQPMATVLALLPSPLLGPSVWQPAAEVLQVQGWITTTCTPAAGARTARDVLDAFVAGLPADDELVLVAHSNAGAYVPAITSRHRSIVGAVFVDAVMPPERGHVPLAPPAFLDFLRIQADADGLLPVWTDWWEKADVAALFPDDETRRRIEREQTRLPLSYFKDQLPVPEGWDDRPAAYLAFGNTYGPERDEAERRQWPVNTLPGEHLHLLNDPAQVVATLIALLDRLGINSSRR